MASSAGGVSWSRAASPMAAALPEVAPLSTIKAPESSAKGATARLKIDRTFGWRAASKLPSRIMIELDFRLTLDAAVPGVSRACSSIGGFIVYSFAWWIQYHTRAGRPSPALKIGHPCRLWWDRRFRLSSRLWPANRRQKAIVCPTLLRSFSGRQAGTGSPVRDILAHVFLPFGQRQIAVGQNARAQGRMLLLGAMALHRRPQTQCLVIARGGQLTPIRTEGHQINHPGVSQEWLAQRLAVGHVPQHDVSGTGSREGLAIGAERDVGEQLSVAFQGLSGPEPGGNVPDIHGVGTGGCQQLPVRAEGHAPYRMAIAAERPTRRLAGRHIP